MNHFFELHHFPVTLCDGRKMIEETALRPFLAAYTPPLRIENEGAAAPSCIPKQAAWVCQLSDARRSA
jgi:hypothetical protein